MSEEKRFDVPDYLTVYVQQMAALNQQHAAIEAQMQQAAAMLRAATIAAGVDVPERVSYRDGAFWAVEE